jgi:threonyl-tRNA synthetase
MFVVGQREMEADSVALRDRLEGDQGTMTVAAAIEKLQLEIADRTVRKTFSGTAGLGERSSINEY